ncbi:type II toxin-antitoxin system HipA family toxin [Janibacter sp. HTCC2649]|uniref:type II toxin-antitoxin system HipA family toxin n=1 Tax=Janibacter sp. HTCC2649 TaxID=313589 RepID=UPI0003247E3C|nr:type II toxin-antitoxin system HipA family toxin [Janibacter sp. HTCC2649]
MNEAPLLVQLQRIDGNWVDVGVLRTRYDTNWFETFEGYWSLARRPVLGQVFEDHRQDWKPSTKVAIPRWFSHLLPEGSLRNAVANAAGINRVRELPLLSALGAEDLPGALRVFPWDGESDSEPPTDPDDDDSAQFLDPVLKFSLAGLQMKFSIHSSDRGLTVPVSGAAGNMILKLPDRRAGFEGVPEAEFAAMTLASRAGLRVPRVAMVDARTVDGLGKWAESGGRQSFAIERFDRRADGQRIHVEEFAQIFDIATAREQAKYRYTNFEAVANVSARLTGIDSVGEVIDRIVFNVLIGNGDAHLKNWAVEYPDGINPELSPLYDVVPTVLYVDEDDLGLNLNGSKRFVDVLPDSFGRIGKVTEFGESQAIARATEAVHRVREVWPELKEMLPSDQFERLTQRMGELPLSASV